VRFRNLPGHFVVCVGGPGPRTIPPTVNAFWKLWLRAADRWAGDWSPGSRVGALIGGQICERHQRLHCVAKVQRRMIHREPEVLDECPIGRFPRSPRPA
jgi:hypothetical protein